MIYRIERMGKSRTYATPSTLPCGCPTIHNVRTIGINGKVVNGVTGANSATGWMRVQRWTIEPELVQTVNGQQTVKDWRGVEEVQLQAPFAIFCVKHGELP